MIKFTIFLILEFYLLSLRFNFYLLNFCKLNHLLISCLKLLYMWKLISIAFLLIFFKFSNIICMNQCKFISLWCILPLFLPYSINDLFLIIMGFLMRFFLGFIVLGFVILLRLIFINYVVLDLIFRYFVAWFFVLRVVISVVRLF